MSLQPVERIEAFTYGAGGDPEFPCHDGLSFGGAAEPSMQSTPVVAAAAEAAAGEAAELARRSIEAARARGVEEGRRMEREALVGARQANERQYAERAIELASRFAGERERFFDRAEQETVRLALAIASRILRREAQSDPLMLTGVVRVALGQLSDASDVRLRVPAAHLDLWMETMAHLPRLSFRPEVVPDDAMQGGDCVMESSMGSADLGLEAQILEIERGLLGQSGQREAPAAMQVKCDAEGRT